MILYQILTFENLPNDIANNNIKATVILLWPVVRDLPEQIPGLSLGQFVIVLMMGARYA